MLTLTKRFIAVCAMALAVGTAGLTVSITAHAEDAKPAATETAAPAADAAAAPAPAAAAPTPNKGDTAWMLICTALVLLMTLPGLALFYGGLARSKDVLSIMIQCMVIFSVITVLWAVYGYSIAFTEGGAFFGVLMPR